ncbi:hypothetical protein N665_1868s0009 [Sinapis alba]|nr:hypothetical protein N665_1868s0009 [Sinapis alba]
MDDLKSSCGFITVEAESNPESLQQWLSLVENGKTKKTVNGTRRLDISTKAKKHLSSLGWLFAYFPRRNKKRELRYQSPKGKWFYSLSTACSSCVHDGETAAFNGTKALLSVDESKKKRKRLYGTKPLFNLKKRKKTVNDGETAAFNGTKALLNVDESKKKRKRVNDGETAAFSGTKALVNVDESNKKRKTVNYGETAAFSGTKALLNVDESKKRKRVDDFETAVAPNEEKSGLSDVNEDILNNDCETAAFDSEAKGEIRTRFKKSLRKVLQGVEKRNEKCEKESVRFWRKDCDPDNNSDVCSVCHFGGDLILCDGCPSSFHHTCIGLSILPEEELWFCPCCCCGICESMETVGNSKMMTCEQCQRKFHLKCSEEESCLVSCRWFCSKKCSGVFSALQSLLGRKIPVGEEGLVWSLTRAPNDDERYDDAQMSKLDSAVKILHLGFEPTKDPFSGRDLVEELVFRKEADGAGYWFYTVLIERGNEPVTVAVLRVHRDVAEIPLVATLSKYRRSGMCRVLMDELEKQMSRMGVLRLVLPAATEVVTTWSQGFGFSVMESRERLECVKHGMLDFVGTVMCHKFLRGREVSGESSLTE